MVTRLRAAGCVAAEDEAAELVDGAPDDDTLEAWIRRREAGEPLAWITGRIEFCGRALHVDAGVYVPRLQTEELVRRAAAVLGSGRAADLCTGSGAVPASLAALCPGSSVLGVDVDEAALACARRNGVPVILGDLTEPLATGSVDVVTAVAPYVPTGELRLLPPDVLRYEPPPALDGGPDGLDVVRRIVVGVPRVLRPGGWLLLEIGGDQDRAVAGLLAGAGFRTSDAWRDEDGDLRGIVASIG